MFLWDRQSVIDALKDEIISIPDKIEITNVVFDSRRVVDGSLFLALKGEKNDGHNFIKNVLELNKTTYVLAEKIPSDIDNTDRIILVKNTSYAFERMALYRRNQLKGKVISVTGSLGKTSTKDLLYTVLSDFGKAHCNMMSFNNYSGLLTTMVNTPIDTDYAIFEIGVDEKGQMLKLINLIHSNISIITNIEPAHFANFNNLEEIAFEKSEILIGTSEIAILNKDNKFYSFLKEKAKNLGLKIISFGKDNNSDIKLENFEIKENLKSDVLHKVFNRQYNKEFNTIDENIIFNSLSVLGVVNALNLDVEKTIDIISEKAITSRGRNNLEIIEYEYNNKKVKLNVINGVFNAVNPKAFDSGFSIMRNSYFFKKRKVCIFGGINEAGSQTKQFHLDVINKIQDVKVDVVILFNEYFRDGYNILKEKGFNVYFYNTASDVLRDVKDILQDDDLVFIKSSKYNKSYEIFNFLAENNKMDLFL